MLVIQTIIFQKSVFSEKRAIKWLKSNGFKHDDIDVKDRTIHFRQRDPQELRDEGFTHFYTEHPQHGIAWVVVYESAARRRASREK